MKLLVSDLHLTDAPNEAYRWKIFDEIRKQLQERQITELIFLGDLTDKKDKHSSILVNKLVNEITFISTTYKPIEMYFLKGNHDYTDENSPFFAFLSELQGVSFISKPTKIGNNFFIPHVHNATKDHFVELLKDEINTNSFIFLHQPFLGATLNEKYEIENCLDGVDLFKDLKGRVFSGDIHIPQILGNVLYVGAPYPLHYGDVYEGRFILIESRTKDFITTSIPIQSIKKHFITLVEDTDLSNYKIDAGDHCSIKIKILKESVAFIDIIKATVVEQLKKLGVEIYQIDIERIKDKITTTLSMNTKNKTSKEIYAGFCKKENLSLEWQEYGLELLC